MCVTAATSSRDRGVEAGTARQKNKNSISEMVAMNHTFIDAKSPLPVSADLGLRAVASDTAQTFNRWFQKLAGYFIASRERETYLIAALLLWVSSTTNELGVFSTTSQHIPNSSWTRAHAAVRSCVFQVLFWTNIILPSGKWLGIGV